MNYPTHNTIGFTLGMHLIKFMITLLLYSLYFRLITNHKFKVMVVEYTVIFCPCKLLLPTCSSLIPLVCCTTSYITLINHIRMNRMMVSRAQKSTGTLNTKTIGNDFNSINSSGTRNKKLDGIL